LRTLKFTFYINIMYVDWQWTLYPVQ